MTSIDCPFVEFPNECVVFASDDVLPSPKSHWYFVIGPFVDEASPLNVISCPAHTFKSDAVKSEVIFRRSIISTFDVVVSIHPNSFEIISLGVKFPG